MFGWLMPRRDGKEQANEIYYAAAVDEKEARNRVL